MKWIQNIKNSDRNLSEVSINKYITDYNILSKGYNGKIVNTLTWLKNSEKVMEFININGNKKNRLTSILTILSPAGKDKPKPRYKAAYNIYKKELFEFNLAYKNNANNKNIKEEKNWITFDEILKFRAELEKPFLDFRDSDITHKKQKDLQRLLILSLYTLLPPRRLEYALTKVISYNVFKRYEKKNPALIDNNVYLVIKSKNKKFFSYGHLIVKSKNSNINTQVEVPPKLNYILNIHLDYHHEQYLLFQFNRVHEPMSMVSLCKALSSLFVKKFNKKISCNMLRKIYITNKTISIKKLAQDMNHTVSVQQNIYLKED